MQALSLLRAQIIMALLTFRSYVRYTGKGRPGSPGDRVAARILFQTGYSSGDSVLPCLQNVINCG